MTAPVTVAVTGGSDGITAQLEDLRGMAALLHGTEQAIGVAAADLRGAGLQWTIDGTSSASACGADQAQAGLSAVLAGLADLDREIGATGFTVLRAADEYEHNDTSVLGLLLGGASGLLTARSDLAARLLSPGLVLPHLLAEVVVDGRPAVRDLGVSTTGAPPSSLADLVGELAERNHGAAGEISVAFVTGADGVRRAIVDLPGTKSWSPLPVADVTSLGTDIDAMAGERTTYERGVFEAMRAAGVTRDMPVLMVGHSEGGIVAVDAARHAAQSGDFAITHVVTAGSPVGELSRLLPGQVQLLALENRDDLVPMLDTEANPDRRNVTTVRASLDHHGIVANHDLDGVYVPEAAAADASGKASVDDFLAGADGFLTSADGTGLTTHAFLITRVR